VLLVPASRVLLRFYAQPAPRRSALVVSLAQRAVLRSAVCSSAPSRTGAQQAVVPDSGAGEEPRLVAWGTTITTSAELNTPPRRYAAALPGKSTRTVLPSHRANGSAFGLGRLPPSATSASVWNQT
jgi:hypothetical protein